MGKPSKEIVVASVGDTIVCPGCGETLTLHWAYGWRNDGGYTCNPSNTSHTDHIETLRTDHG